MLTKEGMVRGDTFSRTIYVTENDAVVNITGWSIFFSLKKNWQLPNSEASLSKIITSHTNPSHGETVLELLPADTQNLDPMDYDFDIQILTDTGEVFTVLRGKFTLEWDVTMGTSGTAGT
ncbi:MAG: hypothetical protein NT030_08045 [Candidatus Saganbacteria bacterium]|nr:hypothetical protein [Candidatus Saganbacteria bacterium]